MKELNPRIMKTNPWNTLEDSLEECIDKVILQKHPEVLDDDIEQVCNDWDNREEAMNFIINYLKEMRDE